jgi:uncharacterized alkaline shock family protein YloU
VQDHPFSIPSELGSITISGDAIAQIVGHTASRCYGVVGLVPQTRFPLLGQVLGPGGTSRFPRNPLPWSAFADRRLRLRRDASGAIRVSPHDGGVRIDLHVSVEYGLNLAEVAATVRSQVAYEVERLTGLSVSGVEVHIEKVRRSA